MIERNHFRGCDQVAGRIESIQVRQHEASGIANPPVGIGDLPENLIGNRHFAAIVGGRHPQAQDISAIFVKDFFRGHGIAQRLRHLPAVGVDKESVGQHFPVGSAAVHGDGGLERGLEPAAVLVRAFQVQISRIAELLALVEHGEMGDA